MIPHKPKTPSVVEVNNNENAVETVSPTTNSVTTINYNVVEPVTPTVADPAEKFPANKKRREPEGGNEDPPTLTS